jgi:hypothetical protein
VLLGIAADDSAGQARYAAFLQGLQQLGWTDGRNVRIDARGGAAIQLQFPARGSVAPPCNTASAAAVGFPPAR